MKTKEIISSVNDGSLSISRTLSDLIKKSNIELAALSKYTGVPVATINRIKNDPESNPTISTLIPLAKFFSISLDELISHENEKLKNNKRLIPIVSIEDFAKLLKSIPNVLTLENSVEVTSKIGTNCLAVAEKIKTPLTLMGDFCYYITEPGATPRDRDIVIAKIERKKPDIFKIFIDSEDYHFKSIRNEDHKNLFSSNNFKILGVVRQIIFE